MKLGVPGEEGHFFSQTLGDENAVERVTMMKGKVNRATDMGPRDGKWFCDFLIDPLFSEALESAQKLEFFKGDLDSELPKCGFADPQFVLWIFQCSACCWRKGRVLVSMPEKGMAIDQEFHCMYS